MITQVEQETIEPQKNDYKGIKQGVAIPKTSAKKTWLMSLGHLSKKTHSSGMLNPMFAKAFRALICFTTTFQFKSISLRILSANDLPLILPPPLQVTPT